MAVCSTSNERAVSNIVRVMLGPEVARVMRVFAGAWWWWWVAVGWGWAGAWWSMLLAVCGRAQRR